MTEPTLLDMTGIGKSFGGVPVLSEVSFAAERGKEFGLAVPQVPFPKSMDEAGRQWTATGDDKPTKR